MSKKGKGTSGPLAASAMLELLEPRLLLSAGSAGSALSERLGWDQDTSLYAPLGDATPTGDSYMLTDHWGGSWSDAEKVPPEDGEGEDPFLPGTADDLMCWAATASNVLRWTGWGGMTTADVVFSYFQNHWTDEGGMMEWGWEWWFDGTYSGPTGWDWSEVDVAGGGFYPSLSFYDYFHEETDAAMAMSAIDSYLHAGSGVGLGVSGPGDHAITCWGFNYDPNNPASYKGIWVSDSDDDKSSSSPPDRLRYYEVENSGGMWYLHDFYGTDDWYIDTVQSLDKVYMAPSASVAATDPLAWEPGGDTGTFRITRAGMVDAAAVSFTMSGTAVRGTDYNLMVDGQLLVGDSVDIPAFATFVDVVLVPVNDTTFEPNQQAVLTLHATPDYTVKPPGSASVLIRDNLPVLSLQATDALAAETVPGEAANPGTFWISRTQTDMSKPLVVNFNLTGSTATSGSDYVAIGSSVTIPAGARFTSVPIAAIDDDLLEGQETVVMTLATDPSYAVSPTAGTATVTILDNDPTVSVTASAAQAAEAPPGQKPKPGALKIVRSGTDETRSVTVQCDYSWGTATAGVDYAALPEFVTIPAGVTSVTLPVTILDDDLAEPAETIVLRLVSGGASQSTATITIADNEPIVSVAASTAQAAETLQGQKPKPGAFTVTRAGGDINQPLTVKYALSGSAATDGSDYEALTGEVTIPAGAKSAPIPVTVIDDDEGEGCETVVLTLSADAKYNVNPKQQAGTVKIADNEPIVSVKASLAQAAEVLPGQKPKPGAFTVTRAGGDISQPLTVKYALSGSAATDGSDYEALTGEVTIPAGAKSASIPVTVIDDDEGEGCETVVLTLSADAKYNVNPKQQAGTVKIADNEPIVAITASDARAAEVAPGKPLDLGAFIVTRTGGDLSKDLLVKYTLAGTADSGIDFEALSGEVTILAGAKTARILVTPKADGVPEEPETIILTLLTDRKYVTVPKKGAATVTLIDNVA